MGKSDTSRILSLLSDGRWHASEEHAPREDTPKALVLIILPPVACFLLGVLVGRL